MTYSGFQVHFEKIAERQTRSFMLRNDPLIPDGDYAVLPMFCDDKKCDCRRALINVLQVSPEFGLYHAATISYGWEPRAFYEKWGLGMDEDKIDMFMGPAIDWFNQQSQYSEAILKNFKDVVLDEEYRQRLERQYAMFKYKQGMKLPPSLLKLVGIYEPCPCGSGKNFKMCCGKAGMAKRRFLR